MYQCALTALLTAQRKMSTTKKQNIAQKKFSLTGGKDDPSKWGQVRMIRENNKKEFKGPEEDMPKYGAGSEYVRAHHMFFTNS